MGKYSDTGCYDAVMVGAGPAGLAAAITLKRTAPDARVLLLEKMHGPARKLSASGNGRGNLSNVKCEDLEEVLKFFSETGIALRTDDEGRIYPYSEDARTVTETLIKRAETEGVVILNDTQVVNVEACSGKGTGFRVFVSGKNGDGRHAGGSCPKGQEILRAANMLIATGGKSYGVYGSTGDGYKMAKALGHTVVPPVPGLTAIETAEPLASAAGTRVKGEVSLFKDGDLIFKERGEIQFRDDSISGICVMNMSSMLPAGVSCPDGAGRFEGYMIRINLVPDFSAAALIGFLRENNLQTADDCSDGGGCVRSAAVRIPATLVKKAIAEEVQRRAAKAGRTSLVDMANLLRGFTLTPVGRKGWKEAQVTRGGVALEEINMLTMESGLVPGLYFAGEVMDYDGPCGGFNLNNAFSTGVRAGKAMGERIIAASR